MPIVQLVTRVLTRDAAQFKAIDRIIPLSFSVQLFDIKNFILIRATSRVKTRVTSKINKNLVVIEIKQYEPDYCDQIVALILNIQQNEFQVPVTLADQPDLLEIDQFYQQRNGEFWVAVNEQNEIVGTIALIDNGQSFGTIRKMFVRADYRGKDIGVAAKLFNNLEKKAMDNKMKSLYLGTVERLKASHRFYEKNGFIQIPKSDLPLHYPLMPVDTMFFMKNLKFETNENA